MNLLRQILVIAFLVLGACARNPESAETQRHYKLTGRILALNAKDQTATVDAEAIPGFMEAMTMEYPIKYSADFKRLHVGDKITATVNATSDGLYDLSNVQRQESGTPK